MTLLTTLQNIQTQLLRQLPPEITAQLESSLTDMLKQNLDKNALKAHDIAPDFTLTGSEGNIYSLTQLLNKQDPTFIFFFRGSWCPFCVAQLQHYRDKLLAGKQATVIAISPQTPAINNQLKHDHHINFTLLSDKGNLVAKKFGLVFTLPENIRTLYQNLGANIANFNGDDSYQLPIPASYVIAPNREILYASVNVNYMLRPDFCEIEKNLG